MASPSAPTRGLLIALSALVLGPGLCGAFGSSGAGGRVVFNGGWAAPGGTGIFVAWPAGGRCMLPPGAGPKAYAHNIPNATGVPSVHGGRAAARGERDRQLGEAPLWLRAARRFGGRVKIARGGGAVCFVAAARSTE